MSLFSVNDLTKGERDSDGRSVLDVYARQADRYVVYQAEDRVVVAYADDLMVQTIQRRRIAPLAGLRSEVDGALVPWRAKSSRWSRLAVTARQYDMRVYPALVEALEGRPAAGLAILQQVRTDIAGEIASRARLAYVVWSIAAALSVLAICLLIEAVIGFWIGDAALVGIAQRRVLLAGTSAGVLGALYSNAIRIRQRTLENDMRHLDYATDAFVRLGLGAVGAFIFECFLASGAIEINFGQDIAPDAGGPGSRNFIFLVLIAGFLAGFVERLVPDLLNSYAIVGREPASPPIVPMAAPSPVTPAPAGSDRKDAQSEPDEDTSVTAPSDEEGVDGCDIHPDDPGGATPDEELPASSGGVARL